MIVVVFPFFTLRMLLLLPEIVKYKNVFLGKDLAHQNSQIPIPSAYCTPERKFCPRDLPADGLSPLFPFQALVLAMERHRGAVRLHHRAPVV